MAIQNNAASALPRFVDKRDNKTYGIVKIGRQTWMAENLRFKCEGSKGYDNRGDARRYGRLYTWEAAMLAAPPGWRLPSAAEWDELFHFAGMDESGIEKLKSKKGGWDVWYNGTNDYGFNAKPGGYVLNGKIRGAGEFGNWWTSSQRNGGYAHKIGFSEYNGLTREIRPKTGLNSVRLIENQDAI